VVVPDALALGLVVAWPLLDTSPITSLGFTFGMVMTSDPDTLDRKHEQSVALTSPGSDNRSSYRKEMSNNHCPQQYLAYLSLDHYADIRWVRIHVN
jgi:hypothetical protein